MLKRRTVTPAIALLIGACGPPPPPPPPPLLDPTGSYDFTVVAEGITVNGLLTIRGSSKGDYAGSIDSDLGSAMMTQIEIDGQPMSFYIAAADMSGEVEFDSTGFNVGMSGGMGAASFRGTKRE